MTTAYNVTAQRTGTWWAITVDELPGVFSQTRRLDQVERMAREAIALFLDVPGDSFDVTIWQLLAPDVDSIVKAAVAARADVLSRQALASAKSREAVQALAALGLPQRDIGRLLDLSHQRVGQLTRGRAASRGPGVKSSESNGRS